MATPQHFNPSCTAVFKYVFSLLAGEAAPQSRPSQTYAELRRQNREAYVQQFRTQR